ncbi:MAG TPA: DUF4190 domain-containing protein [Vicinamibacteria bacterium]|nr:DUF4190 domain-containing protein [Vicinamibacteria bacterium]
MATYGAGVPAGPKKQGMAIASLVIGILAIPTLGCLLIGAAVGIVLGVVALTRASREPEVYGGKGMAIGGIVASAFSVLVAIPLGGIVAAIAIPSLLRARVSANEAASIGDLRSIISAQAAYHSVAGHYGSLDCLAAPVRCVPDYSGPSFLDHQLAAATEKSGYRRRFVGVAAEPGGREGAYSAYAVVMSPVSDRTGIRRFCGDESGRICATTVGEIDATEGRCPPAPACTDLN